MPYRKRRPRLIRWRRRRRRSTASRSATRWSGRRRRPWVITPAAATPRTIRASGDGRARPIEAVGWSCGTVPTADRPTSASRAASESWRCSADCSPGLAARPGPGGAGGRLGRRPGGAARRRPPPRVAAGVAMCGSPGGRSGCCRSPALLRRLAQGGVDGGMGPSSPCRSGPRCSSAPGQPCTVPRPGPAGLLATIGALDGRLLAGHRRRRPRAGRGQARGFDLPALVLRSGASDFHIPGRPPSASPPRCGRPPGRAALGRRGVARAARTNALAASPRLVRALAPARAPAAGLGRRGREPGERPTEPGRRLLLGPRPQTRRSCAFCTLPKASAAGRRRVDLLGPLLASEPGRRHRLAHDVQRRQHGTVPDPQERAHPLAEAGRDGDDDCSTTPGMR